MSDESDWIHAAVLAGQLAAAANEAPYAAQEGRLKSKAEVFFTNYPELESRRFDYNLEPEFWRQYVERFRSLPRASSCDWHTGGFGYVDDRKMPVKAVGVQFLRSDIRACFPLLSLDGKVGGAAELPVISKQTSVSDWAEGAASRGVSIRDARKDAKQKLGDNAPISDICREALRNAKEALGQPVKRGRPEGRKSFEKK